VSELVAAWALTFAGLRQATPLVLAALGGVVSERAGVINIALEGLMVIGAFAGVWADQALGPAGGLAAALGAGAAVGLLHGLFTQRLRLNHIVSGVGINMVALAGTTFLLRRLFHQATPPREAAVAHPLPVAGFVAAALILPFALRFALQRTALGLRLRAVGERAETARMAGIAPAPIRMAAVACSGALAAAAGAYMSLAQVGRFSDDMVSGRGFIALAAVICGRWNPLGAAAAALAFGCFDALQLHLQGISRLPGELLRSVPYLFTIVAAMLVRPRPPADLGKSN
jgi:ABC-type uncharacterized transport system permease subunit